MSGARRARLRGDPTARGAGRDDAETVGPALAAVRARPPRWLALALAAATLAFAARVAGQLAVTLVAVPWLPPPAAWMSGLVPYSLLLPAQLAILTWLTLVSRRYARDAVPQRRQRGRLLWRLGLLYASLNALRTASAVLPGNRWLGDPIPVAFHFLLAAVVLATGAWHLGRLAPRNPPDQNAKTRPATRVPGRRLGRPAAAGAGRASQPWCARDPPPPA